MDAVTVTLAVIAALMTLLGPLLGAITKLLVKSPLIKSPQARERAASGFEVLIGFGFIAFVFAIVSIWRYWDRIVGLEQQIFFGTGLFLTMVAGMFVRVLTGNYGENRPILDVSASRLIFPVLFSPIVFYPIWVVGGEGSGGLFAFYAAFLNGYFWESVVTAAKRPAPAAPLAGESGAAPARDQ